MTKRWCVAVLAAGVWLGPSLWSQAQETQAKRDGAGVAASSGPAASAEFRRFRFVFTLRELDGSGKLVNTRQYATVMGLKGTEGSNAEIRAGVRVPVSVGADTSQYTFFDVGANFDLLNVTWNGRDRLNGVVKVEITSIDRQPAGQVGAAGRPMVLQNRWSGAEEMEVGEQKVLFSSDELTSKDRLEVSLAVEKVP